MPISSEFVGFIRETGVRAFDRLSLRAKDLDLPLRNFVRSWSKLTDTEKSRLFDELIATIRTPPDVQDAPLPAKPRKSVRRYDPEEVAATLPRKPLVGKAAKSATKKKSKPARPV